MFFENVPTASAYAQRIAIANNLDASFDPSSMRLKEIAFGSYTITVPEGRSFYQKRVQLGAEFNYLLADISAGLDIEARQIRWTLTAIDPATGEPPESALLGLLPPNTTNHIGEGHVSYTIKALPGTPTGTIVSNQAVIVFDVNEPIATPSVWNTIDGDIPTSAVASLPVAISNATCVVSWTGQDPTNGSGLASYDIYVSDNGATYIPWLVGTTDTNALFTGVNEHTYYFYSVARDNAGNVEDAPSVPDTATTLYFNSPPTLVPIDNYTVVVNATLMFTNSATDPDLPKQTLTYSLDTNNAPTGASIDSTNGVFQWRPGRYYGSTTNVITVRVTDNGFPPMSSARSFAVSVAEYVEPSLGNLVLHTNQSGCLPISLLSSVGLTNVTLRVEFATNRVSNLSVHALSTNVCTATVVPASGGALVTLGACAGKVFQGEQQMAELCFSVPPQVSAFVPLVITDTTARKANGEKVVNLVNNPGRLTVIGNEPLLEASVGPSREPFLTLYGQPGNEYTLEYRASLSAAMPWTDFTRISVTNSVTPLGALGYDGQQGGRFFRARRE